MNGIVTVQDNPNRSEGTSIPLEKGVFCILPWPTVMYSLTSIVTGLTWSNFLHNVFMVNKRRLKFTFNFCFLCFHFELACSGWHYNNYSLFYVCDKKGKKRVCRRIIQKFTTKINESGDCTTDTTPTNLSKKKEFKKKKYITNPSKVSAPY